jgi:hypothetical protein
VGYVGNDSFTYTVIDGFGGTAGGTVSASQYVAWATPDTLHADFINGVAALECTRKRLRSGWRHVDDYEAVQTPSNGSAATDGQVITYTPGPGFSGSDQFNYTIGDGHGGTMVGQVTLVNMAPVAVADSLHLPVIGGVITVDPRTNDTDPDGDTLTIVNVQTPSNGSAATDGQVITYTPGPGFSDRISLTTPSATATAEQWLGRLLWVIRPQSR